MLCGYVDHGTVRFKVYVCSGLHSGSQVQIRIKHGHAYFLSVVCCVGSASTTSLSLVSSRPTECVCV